MIVVSILALGLVLATPSLESVFARAATKSATDDVAQAFRIAKNTARVTNIPVTLTFTTLDSGNSVVFTFPGGAAVINNGRTMPEIFLPDKITVTAEPEVFTFSPMGMIVGFSEASTVSLTSTIDSSHTATISIVNELGQFTVSGRGSGGVSQAQTEA